MAKIRVLDGDSWQSIATRAGAPLQQLIKANPGIKQLVPGQSVVVPATAKPAGEAQKGGTGVYTAAAGGIVGGTFGSPRNDSATANYTAMARAAASGIPLAPQQVGWKKTMTQPSSQPPFPVIPQFAAPPATRMMGGPAAGPAVPIASPATAPSTLRGQNIFPPGPVYPGPRPVEPQRQALSQRSLLDSATANYMAMAQGGGMVTGTLRPPTFLTQRQQSPAVPLRVVPNMGGTAPAAPYQPGQPRQRYEFVRGTTPQAVMRGQDSATRSYMAWALAEQLRRARLANPSGLPPGVYPYQPDTGWQMYGGFSVYPPLLREMGYAGTGEEGGELEIPEIGQYTSGSSAGSWDGNGWGDGWGDDYGGRGGSGGYDYTPEELGQSPIYGSLINWRL